MYQLDIKNESELSILIDALEDWMYEHEDSDKMEVVEILISRILNLRRIKE